MNRVNSHSRCGRDGSTIDTAVLIIIIIRPKRSIASS